MEIDVNVVRARFSGMTREELLEEAALRADEYTPLARSILDGEVLARGISPAEIDKKRSAETSDEEHDDIDLPAMLTSSNEKEHLLDLVSALRERGIPAVVRELEAKAFHGSGHLVGRWGLTVSGLQAGEAARLLEPVIPAAQGETAAGCGGGCGSCDSGLASSEDEWPEDGDWWKTAPEEDTPDAERA